MSTNENIQNLFKEIVNNENIVENIRDGMKDRGVLWVSVDRGGAVWGWNFKPTYEGTREWQHNYSKRDESMATHLGNVTGFTNAEVCSQSIWDVGAILSASALAAVIPESSAESRPLEDAVAEYLRGKLTISVDRQPNGGILFSLKLGGETFASESYQLPVY